MPPRRPSESAFDFDQPRKRISPNGFRLPDPIREGEILTDIHEKQWRLGRSIGLGGFGEIYLADEAGSKYVGSDARYVIKIEPHENGPLFVEMNFYIRSAKEEMIEDWKQKRRLKHLGISPYLGSGSHTYRGRKYRFLVLERFGNDISQLFRQSGGRFHLKTALYLALQILDTLEYVHDKNYVHADIKGNNLLLGLAKGTENQVYLLDFGLACKYKDRNGVHKECRQDMRKAHVGTIEYTSRDAHMGAHSRRGDLEILGYNLLQWLCGRLPWEDNLLDPEYVHQQKEGYMSNIPSLMRRCFPDSSAPDVLAQYLRYVVSLGFETCPDYDYVRNLFKKGVKEAHYVDDGKLVFGMNVKVPKKAVKHKIKDENVGLPKPRKIVRLTPRQPCMAHNFNRMTRNSIASPVLRSKQFNWAKILQGHPEKDLKKQNSHRKTAASKKFDANMNIPSGNRQRLLSTSSDTFTSLVDEDSKNPTPVMLFFQSKLMQKCTTPSVSRKGKSDYNYTAPATPDNSREFNYKLTYAMEEVLKRRHERESEENDSADETSFTLNTRSRSRSRTRSIATPSPTPPRQQQTRKGTKSQSRSGQPTQRKVVTKASKRKSPSPEKSSSKSTASSVGNSSRRPLVTRQSSLIRRSLRNYTHLN